MTNCDVCLRPIATERSPHGRYPFWQWSAPNGDVTFLCIECGQNLDAVLAAAAKPSDTNAAIAEVHTMLQRAVRIAKGAQ
jgi:hypothetical protein